MMTDEQNEPVVLDDLDTWLGELHNTMHIWLLNLGESREADLAAMNDAEQHIRDMVHQLRADIERIGEELATMRNANAELQGRLSNAALNRISQLRDALNDDPARIEAEAQASMKIGAD